MDRVLIVVAILSLIVLAPRLLRAYVTWRARRGALPSTEGGKPTILYFATDECVQCRVQQAPALSRLRERLGPRLVVKRIDALAQRDVASRYGVLTVPTTVVLDESGEVLAVNLGYTSVEKLARQVALN